MNRYTVAELLHKNAIAHRVNEGRIALTFEGRDVSYDELDQRSNRLASALARNGFDHGERVAVLLYNCVEWAEIFFAVAKLGGVVVPVNYLLRGQEVSHILDDCGATWVIYEGRLRSALTSPGLVDTSRRYIGIDVPGDIEGHELAYEALVAQGSPEEFIPDHVVALDDLLLLQYTSGTTGAPKGAMHTHSTVLWNSFHQVVDYQITADDVCLVVPALCWAAGFHDLFLATMWVGGRVVLTPSRGFDPKDFLSLVQDRGVTITLLVPTVLKRVLLEPTFGEYDASSLRIVCSGGEPVPVTSIHEFHRLLPTCSILQAYGMSEFPTMMLYLDAAHAMAKVGSAGRACSAAEIRIVDADGKDLPAGEVGEIICRSPATMMGYYNKENETAEAIVDGWLHTGDLAHMDGDGFVYVSGRSKDMIITGGLNVYPAEVERVIAQHPAVLEVAVVGQKDTDWGEIGYAFVVLQEGADLGEDELRVYLNEQLAKFKIPQRFTIGSDPLPRTTSGKVQKFRMRETLEI